jgi:hypothetical protein
MACDGRSDDALQCLARHNSWRCSVSWTQSARFTITHRTQRYIMKIVVIGGTGLIGSKLVTKLLHAGHVTAAVVGTDRWLATKAA